MLNWLKKGRKGALSYETNEDWINALSQPVDERALETLRMKLIQGLKPALYKYVDRELDQFVEDVAQDALLKILDNIHTFRGDSKLLTWAMKIAVRVGLSELRLKRYNDISIEDLKTYDDSREVFSLEIADSKASPERAAHEAHLLDKVITIINEELSSKQKRAINALLIEELPTTAVIKLMDTNRNALHKMIYDARIKLKNRFEAEGINPNEMLNKL